MLNPSHMVAEGLQAALNAYLRLDPAALAKTADLAGKVIALEVIFAAPQASSEGGVPGFTLYLLPGVQGIRVAASYAGKPDVLIRGTPLGLARQLQGTDLGAVEIRGDSHTGKALRTLLQQIDIDWEEQLAGLIGDPAARQVGNLWRDLRDWGRQASATLFLNAGEYLREEARHLPPKGAVAEFMDAVDTLREDTDRLEARIRRLQQSGHHKSPRTSES